MKGTVIVMGIVAVVALVAIYAPGVILWFSDESKRIAGVVKAHI